MSLLVFNRVYKLEIQSVMLVFSTPLVNQRGWGEGIRPQTDKHLPPSTFTGKFFRKADIRVWCLYRQFFHGGVEQKQPQCYMTVWKLDFRSAVCIGGSIHLTPEKPRNLCNTILQLEKETMGFQRFSSLPSEALFKQ